MPDNLGFWPTSDLHDGVIRAESAPRGSPMSRN
jgi:hypothetical protein